MNLTLNIIDNYFFNYEIIFLISSLLNSNVTYQCYSSLRKIAGG